MLNLNQWKAKRRLKNLTPDERSNVLAELSRQEFEAKKKEETSFAKRFYAFFMQDKVDEAREVTR